MDAPAPSPAVLRFLAALTPGDVVHGTVARIETFGVLADLDGGPEPEIGYVPPNELSWSWISSAAEVVTVGGRIAAEVLALDTELRGQAVLSLRARQVNPWPAWADRAGTVVTGRVEAKHFPYGVFVDLGGGISGLLPHDGPDRPVAGQELPVRIAEVDVLNRRIRLARPGGS